LIDERTLLDPISLPCDAATFADHHAADDVRGP
jgi:hypothetical protein